MYFWEVHENSRDDGGGLHIRLKLAGSGETDGDKHASNKFSHQIVKTVEDFLLLGEKKLILQVK